MYKRYQQLPVWGRIVAVMVVLFVIWLLLQIVLGIVKALIPLAIVATVIVGALWLFEKVKD